MFRKDQGEALNMWILMESKNKEYWTINFDDILNVFKS